MELREWFQSQEHPLTDGEQEAIRDPENMTAETRGRLRARGGLDQVQRVATDRAIARSEAATPGKSPTRAELADRKDAFERGRERARTHAPRRSYEFGPRGGDAA